MAKTRTTPAKSKEVIVTAAEGLLRERGASGLTVEGVARVAGCAKGLVHYHFRTKNRLLEAVAEHLARSRERRWSETFRAPSARVAIERSWSLLASESHDGTVRAWISMFGPSGLLPDQTVSNALARFSTELGTAAHRMLRDLGMEPRIPASEVGWLLGAVVHGMGLQLLSVPDGTHLEGAYAAAWLGILSLAGPGTGESER